MTLKWYNENLSSPRAFKVAFIFSNSSDPTCTLNEYDHQRKGKLRCMPQFDDTGQPVWTTVKTKQLFPDKRYVKLRLDADPGSGTTGRRQ